MTKLTLLTTAFVLSTSAAMAQDMTPGGHFVANWDLNGDGTVTLEEATEKRGDVFTTFDADENGKLSTTEYDMFDEARANDQADMKAAMGKGKGMGNGHGKGMGEEGGMMRAFNDTDADGFVSRDEFMAKTPDWIAMMDRNADGAVTADDFGPGN